MKRICRTCKKEFQEKPSRIKNGRGKYCSRKCLSISQKDRWAKEKNPRWNNGKYIHTSGYICIFYPNHPFCDKRGYVFQHRIIIEKQIKRYLKPTESSHHLGKKDDNKPKMLIAFTSESAHQRFHHNPSNVKSSEIIFDGRKEVNIR